MKNIDRKLAVYMALNMDVPEIVSMNKNKLTWTEIENESEAVQRGEFVIPEEQFRNQDYTESEMIENAYDLLYPKDYSDYSVPVGTIVYHGGITLDEARKKPHYVFFVSTEREDAEKYGPITEYRVVKNYPFYTIMYDQLAANYGFDVDISQFKTVEEFDDYISFSDETVKEAEYAAHRILDIRSKEDEDPLVIGSWQDNEFGFFPTAYDALEPL